MSAPYQMCPRQFPGGKTIIAAVHCDIIEGIVWNAGIQMHSSVVIRFRHNHTFAHVVWFMILTAEFDIIVPATLSFDVPEYFPWVSFVLGKRFA